MKDLFVSQYYAPETVPIPSRDAWSRTAKGYWVRVLAGFHNYPEGRPFDEYRQHWREAP